MIYFIVGGSKSTKSIYAENIVKSLNKNFAYYVATMKPCDEEDIKRIENHIIQRQGFNFKTIETYYDFSDVLKIVNCNDTILVDSLTSILTNNMFLKNEVKNDVYIDIIKDIKNLSLSCSNLVLVSDYIFSDSIIYDEYIENFRRELGLLNTKICEFSDIVVECFFNNAIIHKGSSLLK